MHIFAISHDQYVWSRDGQDYTAEKLGLSDHQVGRIRAGLEGADWGFVVFEPSGQIWTFPLQRALAVIDRFAALPTPDTDITSLPLSNRATWFAVAVERGMSAGLDLRDIYTSALLGRWPERIA